MISIGEKSVIVTTYVCVCVCVYIYIYIYICISLAKFGKHSFPCIMPTLVHLKQVAFKGKGKVGKIRIAFFFLNHNAISVPRSLFANPSLVLISLQRVNNLKTNITPITRIRQHNG